MAFAKFQENRFRIDREISNCSKAIFYANPNSPENFVKLYSVFQKLNHLTCNELKLRRSSLPH